MKLSTHIHRGLVTFALCAAMSAYAATHSVSTPSAAIPMLGTITVTAPHDAADEIVYTQVYGKARVTVGEPVTLGPKLALPQFAVR